MRGWPQCLGELMVKGDFGDLPDDVCPIQRCDNMEYPSKAFPRRSIAELLPHLF